MWAKSELVGSDDNLKDSVWLVKYDKNAAGVHRFTSMLQADGDEGTLNQRALPQMLICHGSQTRKN